jgi:hypothetical protein
VTPDTASQKERPSRAEVLGRVAASLAGGYVFVWGFTTLGIALVVSVGVPYGEAERLFHLLAFLLFLAAFCWTFSAASLGRVWAVLGGGGAIMAGAAWGLTRVALGG